MTIGFEIKAPVMPHCIYIKQDHGGLRQDGFKPNNFGAIPIEDLTVEQANEYAELMKLTFIEHYNKIKNL